VSIPYSQPSITYFLSKLHQEMNEFIQLSIPELDDLDQVKKLVVQMEQLELIEAGLSALAEKSN